MNQAKYLQEQLEAISNALNALQADNSSIADACHCWLKLINDDILHPYREKVNHRFTQAMTPFHLFSYLLHPKYRGRGMNAKHLQSVHQLVSNKWQEVLVDLCAFQAEAMPFPSHMFNQIFLENIDPCNGGYEPREATKM